MMTTDSRQTMKGLAAALMSALLCAQSASPAFAQRRRAEPEANPAFQDEMQKQARPVAGGPIGEGEAAPQEGGAEAAAAAAAPAEPAAQAFPPQAPRSVQIGAASSRRAAPAEPTDPLETRIVVRVKSAPLSTFLDTISAQAKVNFIITEGLEEKRITAFLQNVTVREALQILLEIKGLTYQRIGKSNTYVVSPRAKGVPNRITRIYTLNYIPLMATDGTKDFASSNQQTGSAASMGSALPGSSTSGSSGASASDAQSAAAILRVLQSVLTKEYGKVAIDPRTNALIITDIPEVFPQVEQILAELDKKSPQVMIEAQIVEIDSDRAQYLGLEWGGSNGELATFTGPKRDTSFPLNMPKSLSSMKFFDPVNDVQSAAGGSGGQKDQEAALPFVNGFVTGVLDLTQLRVILRALVTRAEARFLGKPKILAINNKTAVIQIAQNQAVSIQTLTTGSNAGVGSSGTQAERYNTGLKLSVTPQINKEGFITMLVEPSFTNVSESKISSQTNPVFDPLTRGASTLVRVKNGDTLVLGGLLSSRETKQVRKVPLLGYIPLLGWLFTSVSTQRANTDLVIFVTPRIVND